MLTSPLRQLCLRLILRSSPKEEVKGIRLADFTCDHRHWEPFVELTRHALDFIEESDPRRFGWVTQTIGTIAHGPLVNRVAVYLHPGRTCVVDIEQFLLDDYSTEILAAAWAMVLVHEATHGRLFQRGIPYNRRTRLRVEQRCVREQQRFVKRCLEWMTGKQLTHERVEAIIPFSQDACEASWNTTLLEQIRSVRARI